MIKPTRAQGYTYDTATHRPDSLCPQKWFWCRIHWWPRFEPTGEKWYEPYPLTMNRKAEEGWINTQVYCGPGTFYPKPVNNRSYERNR